MPRCGKRGQEMRLVKKIFKEFLFCCGGAAGGTGDKEEEKHFSFQLGVYCTKKYNLHVEFWNSLRGWHLFYFIAIVQIIISFY